MSGRRSEAEPKLLAADGTLDDEIVRRVDHVDHVEGDVDRC